MAEPTYEDLRAAYMNAEDRADQLAERLGKTDAELVATRIVAREAKEALAEAEASSDERGQAANHLIEDLAAEKAAREKAGAENTRLSSRVAVLETASAEAATKAADAACELDHTEDCDGDDWCDCPVGVLRRLARDVRAVLASAPTSDNTAKSTPGPTE